MTEDLSDLASALSSVSRSLEEDGWQLILEQESGSIGDISADSWSSSDSNFVFWSLVTWSLNLDELVGSSVSHF